LSDERLKKIVRITCLIVIGISIAILLIEIFSAWAFIKKLDEIGWRNEENIKYIKKAR
jgi:Ca2+/Na+ antiporter